MARKIGYYWVKITSFWEIAEWQGKFWLLTGAETAVYDDSYFCEIKEQQLICE